MKLLVLSDSHSGLRFMRQAVAAIRPDAVVHLGDHYEDGKVLAQENPYIVFHQVPGNCDRYGCLPKTPETLCYDIGGVRFFMTHGHNHRVKAGLYALLLAARDAGAAAVLYGHTHIPDCHQEDDGLWILNPGSCGSSYGSVGLIELEDNKIRSCRILRLEELEAMK